MYSVVLSAEAEKIYASADQALAKKIARCFEQLEQNPRFHPLMEAGIYPSESALRRMIKQTKE